MRLYLVRHGITGHNASRVFMGHDPVPLSAEGRDQVRRLVGRLREEAPEQIVASDLRRTVESAEILSEGLGLPISTHAALREVNVGTAKGLSYEDVARRWPEIGNGAPFPGGESFADVADRATRFLRDEIVPAGYERVLVVAHGGVIRGVGARLLDEPLESMGIVDNGSVTIVETDGARTNLVVWNERP